MLLFSITEKYMNQWCAVQAHSSHFRWTQRADMHVQACTCMYKVVFFFFAIVGSVVTLAMSWLLQLHCCLLKFWMYSNIFRRVISYNYFPKLGSDSLQRARTPVPNESVIVLRGASGSLQTQKKCRQLDMKLV